MLIGIEHLPVMQLEIERPLPPDVKIVEFARIEHLIQDGRIQRKATWVLDVLGRSPTNDVYYLIEHRDKLEVGLLNSINITGYDTLFRYEKPTSVADRLILPVIVPIADI